MSHKATRHVRIAARLRALAPTKPTPMPHVILDPHHQPDLRGEFAGAKVTWQGGKQVVYLHPEQAKFYLDQGAIAPLSS